MAAVSPPVAPPQVVSTAAVIALLITSADSDPTAELPFAERDMVSWDAVVDVLSGANYSVAMRRLTAASGFPRRVAILSLHASKKAADFFFHSDDLTHYYEISHDEMLMDDLPSHLNIEGLPRFHRFMSLPEELQLSVVRLLDGVSFAGMRCMCRRFSLLRWDRHFDIMQYSCPRRIGYVEAEEWGWDNRVPLVGSVRRRRAPSLMMTATMSFQIVGLIVLFIL